MEKTIIDDLTEDLNRSIQRLESMMESYKVEMIRNYQMLETIKGHLVRTNNLLTNIRNIMSK